jgi:hypothetical protein
MADMPRGEILFRDFRGMASNSDPTDLQPGFSQEQINVDGRVRGTLEVRRGLKEMTFDEEDD